MSEVKIDGKEYEIDSYWYFRQFYDKEGDDGCIYVELFKHAFIIFKYDVEFDAGVHMIELINGEDIIKLEAKLHNIYDKYHALEISNDYVLTKGE